MRKVCLDVMLELWIEQSTLGLKYKVEITNIKSSEILGDDKKFRFFF